MALMMVIFMLTTAMMKWLMMSQTMKFQTLNLTVKLKKTLLLRIKMIWKMCLLNPKRFLM